MKAEYINPFLQAFNNVIEMLINIKPSVGKVYVKEGSIKSGEVAITIGVTGDLTGSVTLNMSELTAKNIASKMMMGMEVNELNDLAKSAISELGNMVAGNSTSFFMNMGKSINITPPSLYTGSNMSIYAYKGKALCVPMMVDSQSVEIDISVD